MKKEECSKDFSAGLEKKRDKNRRGRKCGTEKC